MNSRDAAPDAGRGDDRPTQMRPAVQPAPEPGDQRPTRVRPAASPVAGTGDDQPTVMRPAPTVIDPELDETRARPDLEETWARQDMDDTWAHQDSDDTWAHPEFEETRARPEAPAPPGFIDRVPLAPPSQPAAAAPSSQSFLPEQPPFTDRVPDAGPHPGPSPAPSLHPDPAPVDLRPGPAPAPSPSQASFIDRAPPPGPVPDQAPIQSFDQRPRFEMPHSPAPPTSPSAPASTPPGIDATTSPRRRGLLMPAVAFGCALMLLLGIGGGLTGLWLTTRDSAPAPVAEGPAAGPGSEPAAADAGEWRQLAEDEFPAGTSEELVQVLGTNPLTATTLPVPGGCDLPVAAEGKVSDDQLQGLLDAGAGCLATTWSDALETHEQQFEAPRVLVYSMDALPSESACTADSFTASAPRTCLADNTLYWPTEWDPGFSNASLDEVAGLYMWHLSYSYSVFALSSLSLDGYYGALIESLEDDPAQADEMRRRYALQLSCISSAAAFQQPWGTRPADRVAEFVLSVEAQGEPAGTGDPSQDSRAHWVRIGHDARGDLSQCNTWAADAEDVG